MIYSNVRGKSRDTSNSLEARKMYSLIYGEFGRINDGKLIDDKQCHAVLRKMRAGIIECQKYMNPDDSDYRKADRELTIVMMLLPSMANELEMTHACMKVMDGGVFKQPIHAIGKVKKFLEEVIGVEVDGKVLKEFVLAYEPE